MGAMNSGALLWSAGIAVITPILAHHLFKGMGRGKECRGAVMYQVYIPLPATCHWTMKSVVMEPQSQCMWNERESSESSPLDHQDWGAGEQNV